MFKVGTYQCLTYCFQKLEEKFNANEAQNDHMQTKLKVILLSELKLYKNSGLEKKKNAKVRMILSNSIFLAGQRRKRKWKTAPNPLLQSQATA